MEPSHLPCSSLTHPAAILTPSIGVLRWIRVYGAESQAVKRSVRGERLPLEHRPQAVRKGQTPLHFEAGAPTHFRELQQGGRNEALRAALVLFFKTRGREREIEDAEERWGRRIYDAAMSWNGAFPEPLAEARVRSTSRRVPHRGSPCRM